MLSAEKPQETTANFHKGLFTIMIYYDTIGCVILVKPTVFQTVLIHFCHLNFQEEPSLRELVSIYLSIYFFASYIVTFSPQRGDLHILSQHLPSLHLCIHHQDFAPHQSLVRSAARAAGGLAQTG